MIYYVYDGTFNGFLTAVFECFERKHTQLKLIRAGTSTPLFGEIYSIDTIEDKATRVWKGLQKKLEAAICRQLYVCYLSENDAAIESLFFIVQEIFKNNVLIINNYGDERVMLFHKTVKSVEREKHRMKAFIRFEKGADGMYACNVAPDFNVLPLITRFFKNRYADQLWLIYDERRHYGIYYNLKTVEEVQIVPLLGNELAKENIGMDLEESKYQKLWMAYFKHTNIESRKNTKLHLQHVPKRYWRYLTEKNILL